MMASAVMLSGAMSRELISGVLARPSDGVDERAISVGISAALFVLPGLRHMARGRDPGFRGDQMAVAAQHLNCVTTPGTVKRFEQAQKEAQTPVVQPGFAFGGSTHR